MKSRINKEALTEYLRKNAGKLTMLTMCVELGLADSTIRKFAKDNGIEIRTRKKDNSFGTQEKVEILKQKAGKVPVRQIAQDLKVTVAALYYLAKAYNVRFTDREEKPAREIPMGRNGMFNVSSRTNWLI